jgi:Flp pilus assembly CpaE family ATPase
MPLRAHGVDVLPAPESPATRIEMHRQAAHELLSFWREHYDAIVLDTAGTRAQSLDLLQLSDEVLLVASGEVAALYTARRAIEYLEQNGLDSAHIRLVINRYASGSSLSKAEVTAALKLEPYAVLEDEAAAVSEAMLLGRPVAPGSRLGRSVDALAARLLGKEKPIEKRKSLLSLMSRSK